MQALMAHMRSICQGCSCLHPVSFGRKSMVTAESGAAGGPSRDTAGLRLIVSNASAEMQAMPGMAVLLQARSMLTSPFQITSRCSHRRADVSWRAFAGTWRMYPPSCRCWSGSTAALQSAWRTRRRSSTTSTRTSAALPATCLSLCVSVVAYRLSWRSLDTAVVFCFPQPRLLKVDTEQYLSTGSAVLDDWQLPGWASRHCSSEACVASSGQDRQSLVSHGVVCRSRDQVLRHSSAQAEGEGAQLQGVLPGQAVPAAARHRGRPARALWRDAGGRAHPRRCAHAAMSCHMRLQPSCMLIAAQITLSGNHCVVSTAK